MTAHKRRAARTRTKAHKQVIRLLDDVLPPTDEDLPSEVLLDPHHPANDAWYRQKRRIHESIKALEMLLQPKQVHAAKLFHTGNNFTQIAQKLHLTPTTIANYINQPNIQRLVSLLLHAKDQHDSVNAQHRKALLWRITVDNEHDAPNLAIAAIKEMNAMEGTTAAATAAAATTHNAAEIRIVIDNSLHTTSLDNPHTTFESKTLIEHDPD